MAGARYPELAHAVKHQPGVLLCTDCEGIWTVITTAGAVLELDIPDRTLELIRMADLPLGHAVEADQVADACAAAGILFIDAIGPVMLGEPLRVATAVGEPDLSTSARVVFVEMTPPDPDDLDTEDEPDDLEELDDLEPGKLVSVKETDGVGEPAAP